MLYISLATLSCLFASALAENGTSTGRQFLAVFLYNYGTGPSNETENYLFISSEKAGTAHVEILQIGHTPGWSHSQKLNPGSTITIALPSQSEMPGGSVLSKRAVHVFADVDISVHAMNDDESALSADATLVLPVTALSTDYTILTPTGNPVIAIAGLLPNTRVTVNVKSTCTVTYNGNNYANKTIQETLGNQDVLQLLTKLSTKSSKCDMSGTTVSASHPVAVFSGSQCIVKGRSTGCDHEVQQILPNDVLGLRFIVPDLMDNKNYKVKVLSVHDDTHIFFAEHNLDHTINNYETFLDKGQSRQYTIPDGTFLEVFANKGMHVTQYDGSDSPFSIPIPPVETYGWNYTISTMNNPSSNSYVNFLNIVVHRDSTHTIMLDGKLLEQSKWTMIRDLGYSIATIPVSTGSHHLEADDTFMVQVYGYDGVASYAYLAGYYFNNLPSAHLGAKDYPPASTQAPLSTVSGQPAAVCENSPGVNCKILDATLGVCSIQAQATSVCPKFCKRCAATDCSNPGSCVVG